MSLGGVGGGDRRVNAPFRWLVSVSALSLLIGSALLLWGLKVVPVSNPFNSFVRDSSEEAEKRPGPAPAKKGLSLCPDFHTMSMKRTIPLGPW